MSGVVGIVLGTNTGYNLVERDELSVHVGHLCVDDANSLGMYDFSGSLDFLGLVVGCIPISLDLGLYVLTRTDTRFDE